MSASNWTICPNCIKLHKEEKIKFLDKYKAKIDSFVLAKLIKAIDDKIEWMESYSDDGFEQDEDIIKLIEERDYEIEDYLYCSDSDGSCTVREDYEQGIDDNGNAWVSYGASCQKCDLDRDINVEGITKEFKHTEKIEDKK